MDKQFTASEVRDAITWKYVDKLTRISAMLTAFADLLEAREKAVPVATVEDQFGFPIMEWIGDAGEKCPVGTTLYTHSTQAQPPAVSVTDAMVGRAQDCLHDKGKDIGYYHMRAALEAALAAQENPNG